MYNLYFDEIWPVYKLYDKYMFFVVLAVETQNVPKLCKTLDDCRCLNENNRSWASSYDDCENKLNCSECNHKLNNSKIHFTELRKDWTKNNISRKWLELLHLDLVNIIKLNIFVVNLENLDFNCFGKDGVDKNIRIYNKLFRSVINSTYSYLLKDFKTNKFNEINQIYHHRGTQEQHNPFFKNISKLENTGVKIINPNIIFVSGHQELYPKEKIDLIYANTLIQYSDLIIGSFRQLMYQSSGKLEVRKTANTLLEVFEKQENNQYKIKSKYRGIYDLNIWPNRKCSQIDIKTVNGDIISEFPRDNSLYSHSIEFLASKIEPKKLFDFK